MNRYCKTRVCEPTLLRNWFVKAWVLSVYPSCCLLGCFLGIGSLDLIKLCVPDFSVEFFFFLPPQSWGNGPKRGQKWIFLNLKKNLVIEDFPWTCSIMKSYIIWCVLVQVFYSRKMLLLRHRPKCSQSFRLWEF